MIYVKAASTLLPSKALASKKAKFLDLAYSYPVSFRTARKCFKSDLLPTIIITISLSAFSLTSESHLSILS